MTTELTKAAQQALDALTMLHAVYAAVRLTLREKYPDDGWPAETMTLDQAKAAIDALERALTTSQPAQAGEFLKCAMRHTPVWKSGVSGLPYQESNFACETCGYVGKHDMHPGCKKATQPAAQATPDVPETDFGNMVTQQATHEPVGEPLQGGLDNDALLNAWRSKLPGVTPTDAQMTAFALGVEVGFAHARKLERSDWSRVHEALQAAGVHPGRTDDHLADVIAKALANRPAPGVPEDVLAILDECRNALMECDRDGDYALIDRIDALDAAQAKGGEHD